MKKIFLLFLIIIFGCTESSRLNVSTPSKTTHNNVPSETILNSKCEDVDQFEIFQDIDSGALAYACEEKIYGDFCYGLTAFFPNKKGVEYFDGKRIKLENGQCFVYEGTYKYFTRDGMNRTIPIVKIVNSRIPNPEYEEWVKNQNK